MKCGESIHYFLAKPSPRELIRLKSRWQCVTNNKTLSSLHQIKRDADYVCVLTKEERPGCRRKMGIDYSQQIVFTRHVVRGWRDRSEWWSTQDEFVIAVAD